MKTTVVNGVYNVDSRCHRSPNKLFKRDSQRVAFSLCVGVSV